MTAPGGRIGRVIVPDLLWMVIWLTALAWARPLLPPDESRYAGVAWEMLRSGNWLVPTLDGLPFLHKPPLFYWITVGGLAAFGLNEWAARLAPLIGAAASAAALYFFLRRWTTTSLARNSTLVLATQPLFFVSAQFANLDMLVAGCISACIMLCAHAVLSLEAGSRYRGALVAAYALAALGVLAKGLIGAALPALTIVPWLALRGQLRLLKKLISLPGLLIFTVIAAPWFIAMQTQFPDFLHYFVVVQQMQRFANGGFNNVQPFWFYPIVLALLVLPWSLWLYRTDLRTIMASPIRLLMWIWLTVVVLFFSLPQSKLVGYVLPALPPLAYLVAEAVGDLGAAPVRTRRWWNASIAAAMMICLAAITGLTLYHPASTRDIARVLGSQRAAGEPVVFIDSYFYDVPFYSAMERPVIVTDNWKNPSIVLHDNWRKELFEAGRFAPQAAAQILIDHNDLAATVCRAARTWILAPGYTAQRYPLLARAQIIASSERVVLWRMDARDAQCPSLPANAQ